MEGYRNDKAAVAEVLRRGERPDLATTMASGPLDELVALHEELGIFAIVEQLEVKRKRVGVPDALVLAIWDIRSQKTTNFSDGCPKRSASARQRRG